MIRLLHDKKPIFIGLSVLTVLVMLGMLFFGLRLKWVQAGNNVRWFESGKGLVFQRYAMAYTDGFFSSDYSPSAAGLTIEMAIQPRFFNHSKVSFILLVHGGQDERQLVIGQYRSSLLIMNGNDYSNRRRVPKIYVQLAENERAPQFIAIVSNESGTMVFLDGVLKKTKGDLRLHYPNSGVQAKMVLGNSLNGKNSWMGTILGLAVYDRDLGDAVVRQHYDRWRLDSSFKALKVDAPRLLYAFDEGGGERVHNQASDDLDLMIPAEVKILAKKVLAWPHFAGVASTRMVADILINLMGFIPLGFLWMAILTCFEGGGGRTGMLTAVMVAFLFSLCIEIAQVWIPTRDSSLLDLVLNTLGGWMGVLIFGWMRKRGVSF